VDPNGQVQSTGRISHSITGWCGFSRRTTQGKPRNPLVSVNVSQNGFSYRTCRHRVKNRPKSYDHQPIPAKQQDHTNAVPQADCPHRLWWDALSMPPGYIDTSLPVHEPSGMNSQEFDTDDQDFQMGRPNLAAETTP
jgi:hypothetical protein